VDVALTLIVQGLNDPGRRTATQGSMDRSLKKRPGLLATGAGLWSFSD
jgi:hypothetical protein